MTWRDRARPIIQKVLADNYNLPPKMLRKKLREAYPFHERAMHPYKIWLDEIRRQLGLKPERTKQKGSMRPQPKSLPGQLGLFEADAGGG